MIKIQQIKYFLSIIENKSFNKASEKLNISQPAITKAMQDLEENMSVKLIHRLPKGIVSTEYGKIFEKYAYLVLNDISNAEKEIKSLKNGEIGDITVGVAFSPRIHLVPIATINLQKNHPNIKLKIYAGQRMELLLKLLKGEIDLCVSAIHRDDFLFLEEKNKIKFKFLPLYKDTQHIVTKIDHPLQLKKNVTLKDTLDYDWILPDQEQTLLLFNVYDQFIKNNLSMPKPKIVHNSGNFSLNVIKNSNFIGMHPKQMIETQNDGLLKTLDIKGISMEPTYGVTLIKDKPLRKSAMEMIEELKIVSKKMINQELVKSI